MVFLNGNVLFTDAWIVWLYFVVLIFNKHLCHYY